MSKYRIEPSEKVANTRIRLYKLFVNDACNIDEFEKEIELEGQYSEDLDSLYAIVEKACNLTMLPKGMYRILQLGNLPYQVYEAKRGKLRMFLIKAENTGKIILAGGKKTNQKGDIEFVKKLVKDINKEGIADSKPRKK